MALMLISGGLHAMLARIQQAEYDPTTGEVVIQLATSTVTGYQNVVTQYTVPNVISVPKINQVPNLDPQALTQVQITGYSNSLIDENYSINNGEFTAFSDNWYSSTKGSGVEIQEAQTTNIENLMMGQSTNSVLSDILQMLINIIDYLNSHTHEAGDLTAPNGSVTGTTGEVVDAAPDDTDITQDLSYIQDNQNLAITGTYQPKN